ncbi:MAG: T9SS type A sorting domain-containing protein [Candidatus Marinimicrobia bacterium]|nr:T9SS type A sorting domain-containing protein [Candidatus Neomarinimicrobiota bacterium]
MNDFQNEICINEPLRHDPKVSRRKNEYFFISSAIAGWILFFILFISFPKSTTIYCHEINIDNSSNNSPDTSWKSLYPLDNGNFWIYSCYMPYGDIIGYRTLKVIGDTLLGGDIFKKISVKSEYTGEIDFRYERVDTSAYIFEWIYDHQERFLKLNVSKGDTFSSDIPTSDCGPYPEYCHWVVMDVWYNEFGKNILYYWDYLTATEYYLAENMGIYRAYYEGGGNDWLKGCYVNGRLIGDTTLTLDIITDNNYLKEKINISLDVYPNPFNRNISISYYTATKSNISLKIVDLLGRTIKILEYSTEKLSGSYQAIWDGTNQIGSKVASGVYFVILENNMIQVVRKILYIQ